jgi:hypothetical protein
MRILGWLFLVGGSLLCASILWAALGFVCMGLGLIFLQIAEQKRRRVKSAASPFDQSRPHVEPAPVPEATRAVVPPIRDDGARAGRENATGPDSYDEQEWRALLSSDSDISRLANALEPYGRKYVDQFATAYLALNDKNYLPMILRMIIASAGRDSGQNIASDFADNAPTINAGPDKQPGSEPSGPTSSDHVDMCAAHKTATEETNRKPAVAGGESNMSNVNTAPQIAVEATSPEPTRVPDAAGGPDEKKRAPEVDAVDADNLTEILTRLNHALPRKAE